VEPKVLFLVGGVALAVGILLPWFVHPASNGGQDLLDGVRGVFVGLCLGLSITALMMINRRRRS
jgi:hypothetical protein